ncbi:MAG: hypothetical protein LBG74_00610, partial [Spirochaetaceae bacterium]|nr:hypothetical protein [Spirochaetaceae bacterium]
MISAPEAAPSHAGKQERTPWGIPPKKHPNYFREVSAMKNTVRDVVCALLFALLAPAFAAAHGVEVSDVTEETAGAVQTVRFMYSTG